METAAATADVQQPVTTVQPETPPAKNVTKALLAIEVMEGITLAVILITFAYIYASVAGSMF